MGEKRKKGKKKGTQVKYEMTVIKFSFTVPCNFFLDFFPFDPFLAAETTP